MTFNKIKHLSRLKLNYEKFHQKSGQFLMMILTNIYLKWCLALIVMKKLVVFLQFVSIINDKKILILCVIDYLKLHFIS